MIEAQKGHRERAEEEKVPKGTEITQVNVLLLFYIYLHREK